MRFSLQTLLILITGLGAWCALLARLFVREPITFYSVWYFSTNIVPFALAIMAIVALSKDSPHQRRARTWAITLGLVPLAGLAALPILRHFEVVPSVRAAIAQPREIARLSNHELLQEYLPLHLDHRWGWQELADRVMADQVGAAEVKAAVDQLIAFMHENQRGAYRRQPWITSVIVAAQLRQLITDEQLIEFHHVFFGPAELRCSRVRVADLGVDFAINKGRSWTRDVGLGWKLLWHVESVTIDGHPIHYRDDAEFVPILRMTGFDAGDGVIGSYTGRLEPGTHRLGAQLKCAYATVRDAIGIDSRSHPDDWPETIVTWDESLNRTFRVYAADETIFEVTQDPALDPTEFIQVRLEVEDRTKDARLRLRLDVDEKRCPIGFYCDAKVVSDSRAMAIGTVYFVRTQAQTVSGGTAASLESAELLGETVDLVLTPNQSPSVPFFRQSDPLAAMTTIWGKEIVIRDLPVRRIRKP